MNEKKIKILIFIFLFLLLLGTVLFTYKIKYNNKEEFISIPSEEKYRKLKTPNVPYTIANNPASLYFMDNIDDCDKDMFKGSHLIIKHNFPKTYEMIKKGTLNNNCKFQFTNWSQAWMANMEPPKLTPKEIAYRKNHKLWLNLAQPKIDNRKPQNTVNLLITDIKTTNNTNNKGAYYIGTLSHTNKNEIFNKVCSGNNDPYKPILNGKYLVITIKENQYPTFELLNNGAIIKDPSQWIPYSNLFTEEINVVNGIEYYTLVPKDYICNAHIFTKDICGHAVLYGKYPITLRVRDKNEIKAVPTTSEHLMGNYETLLTKATELKNTINMIGNQGIRDNTENNYSNNQRTYTDPKTGEVRSFYASTTSDDQFAFDMLDDVAQEDIEKTGTSSCLSTEEIASKYNINDLRLRIDSNYKANLEVQKLILEKRINTAYNAFSTGNILFNGGDIYNANTLLGLLFVYASADETDSQGEIVSTKIYIAVDDQSVVIDENMRNRLTNLEAYYKKISEQEKIQQVVNEGLLLTTKNPIMNYIKQNTNNIGDGVNIISQKQDILPADLASECDKLENCIGFSYNTDSKNSYLISKYGNIKDETGWETYSKYNTKGYEGTNTVDTYKTTKPEFEKKQNVVLEITNTNYISTDRTYLTPETAAEKCKNIEFCKGFIKHVMNGYTYFLSDVSGKPDYDNEFDLYVKL